MNGVGSRPQTPTALNTWDADQIAGGQPERAVSPIPAVPGSRPAITGTRLITSSR